MLPKSCASLCCKPQRGLTWPRAVGAQRRASPGITSTCRFLSKGVENFFFNVINLSHLCVYVSDTQELNAGALRLYQRSGFVRGDVDDAHMQSMDRYASAQRPASCRLSLPPLVSLSPLLDSTPAMCVCLVLVVLGEWCGVVTWYGKQDVTAGVAGATAGHTLHAPPVAAQQDRDTIKQRQQPFE